MNCGAKNRVANGTPWYAAFSLTERRFARIINTMVALNEAYEKLASLSEERAKHVVSLIDDLAELEARENAEDLAKGREVLARIAAGEKTYPWEEMKKRLDEIPD